MTMEGIGIASKRDVLMRMASWKVWVVGLLAIVVGCDSSPMEVGPGGAQVTLLNVSYDPTREFYLEFNDSFSKHWEETTGNKVVVDQSHGGSGKQSRAVIEGLEADIISLALAGDIDAIAKTAKLLKTDWQSQLPHNSSPYTSTIVFLVRKGNPKNIRDWNDLVREGIEVITPNPKTGGGARWNYLAAWGYVLKKELGDFTALRDSNRTADVANAEKKARGFLKELYGHVPVLDTAARGATNTFLQRKIGDVLLTWENEAFLALKEMGSGEVELVVPSLSILAEPPVAVVTKNTVKHGTEQVARAYLEYLYSPAGQQLAAKHFYRPRSTEFSTKDVQNKFAQLELFSLSDLAADWNAIQEKHFKDRTGIFDQILKK